MRTEFFIHPLAERFLVRGDTFIKDIQYILHAGVWNFGFAIDNQARQHFLRTFHKEVFFAILGRIFGDRDGNALRILVIKDVIEQVVVVLIEVDEVDLIHLVALFALDFSCLFEELTLWIRDNQGFLMVIDEVRDDVGLSFTTPAGPDNIDVPVINLRGPRNDKHLFLIRHSADNQSVLQTLHGLFGLFRLVRIVFGEILAVQDFRWLRESGRSVNAEIMRIFIRMFHQSHLGEEPAEEDDREDRHQQLGLLIGFGKKGQRSLYVQKKGIQPSPFFQEA